MRSRISRQAAKLMACLLALVTLSSVAYAASEPVELDREARFSILYLIDENPVSDVEFQIYRVADVDVSCNYTWTESVSKYSVSLDIDDDTKMQALAGTLSSYLSRDKVQPDATGKTDEVGVVAFTGLTPGMYLVTGNSCRIGRYTHRVVPTLVFFPYTGEDGTWTYGTNIEVKHTSSYNPPHGDDDTPTKPTEKETVVRKAMKLWANDENEPSRPEYVSVQLLRDGEVYDSVVLSSANSWRYTWEDLDAQYQWSVVEETVPEGYHVSIKQEGITFVVTNTLDDIPAPPEEEEKPPEEKPTQPTNPEGTKLPQTGLLWWPVPILAASGIACILVGMVVGRRKREDC